jgi:hypothetical protein
VIDLSARCDFISTADGNSILVWGYGEGTSLTDARAQYPGPTLIVDEGDTVTINLYNWITDEQGDLLEDNTSLVVHGFQTVTSGGTPGTLTQEAAPGAMVSYTFTASRPGTYLYESGTEPWLQVEMGLMGALIVRPTGGLAQLPGPNDANGYATGAGHAYNDASTAFHREYLFILSEMDPIIHDMIEFGQKDQIANHEYFPVYWFINGRVGPDTLAGDDVFYLPTQPYGIFPRMMPGEKLLMRVVGGSRDMHPYHHHGNHARVIAKDGQFLSSGPGAGADLSHEVFTIQSVPGETVDAIFEWTGEDMGWDIYGHLPGGVCNDLDGDGFADAGNPGDARPWEYCADHGKAIPVTLPENQNLAFGGFWSGSPYLGAGGGLPPGEGGLNPYAGYFFMWHSHTEKELCNFDIFPGGMLTMLAVEPPGTPDLP